MRIFQWHLSFKPIVAGILSVALSLQFAPSYKFAECATVERITVHNDGRLVFTFTNGSEETVMM